MYNIYDKAIGEKFILCSCATLEIAQKRRKEMEEIDKKLKEYYNWKTVPTYKITKEK